MSSYAVAPLFLIRAAGVAFDSLERLATRESSAIARELLELQRQRAAAANDAEAFFASRVRLLSTEAYNALRTAVRTQRAPVKVTGEQPPIFTNYSRAAERYDEKLALLRATLDRELQAARGALIEAARDHLPDYLLFAPQGVGATVVRELSLYPSDVAAIRSRHNSARKLEQSLWLYLQRIAAKNDTFSRFGPSAWGTIGEMDSAILPELTPEISAREVFLERWTAHHLARAINSDSDAPNIEVRALEPHAFELLCEEISEWPHGPARTKWLAAAKPVLTTLARFREATEAAERQRLMDEARATLAAIGPLPQRGQRFLYSAQNAIGEECFRAGSFQVQSETIDQVTEQAGAWIDLWRDTYAFVAARVSAGLSRVLHAHDAKAMPLPAFLDACNAAYLPLNGVGLVALAAIAFQEVKSAFARRLQPHAQQREYELSADDCALVRTQFEFPPFDEYTYPSADLQIAASSFDAVDRGDFLWVISELHPAVALLHHGFYWACPDKPRLHAALASTAFGKPSFHFGFGPADFTSHTTMRLFDALPNEFFYVARQPANPKWKTIRPPDAEVFIDNASGDVGLRTRDSHQFLGSFARAWLIPLGFHPFSFTIAPHTPRLRCGSVVVQRESWTLNVDELPPQNFTGVSAELIVAIEALRAARELPRYIYIRPTEQALRRSGAEGRDKDTKPVFIDLESYLSIEIFYRWLRKSGEIEATEMLPDPDHICWHEQDGRRTFELRTLIVPRA